MQGNSLQYMQHALQQGFVPALSGILSVQSQPCGIYISYFLFRQFFMFLLRYIYIYPYSYSCYVSTD